MKIYNETQLWGVMNISRRGVLFVILFVVYLLGHSNEYSEDQNYIMTIEPKYASTNAPEYSAESSIMNIDYVDGLGRRVQSVQVARGGGGEDICDLQEYGKTGKPTYTWVPIAKSSDGLFLNRTEFKQNTFATYGVEEIPYTYTEYENGWLMRPTKISGIGKDMSHKSVTISYGLNSSQPAESCRYFYVDADGKTLCESSNYEPNTLQVTESCDENSNKSLSFTNSEGRVVMERRIGENNKFKDTYYVYDNYGELRYMISPKAIDQCPTQGCINADVINKLCYYYEYSDYGLLIQKKLPGAEPIYYVYNKLNQVIFAQDGNQRVKNEWSVTCYDWKNRIAVEGVAKLASATRQSLQAEWGDTLITETPEPENESDTYLFYSYKSKIPEFTPIRAYFYDNYNHWRAPMPVDSEYPHASNTISANGLLTGMAVKTDNRSVITTAIKYNDKGIPVLQCEKDYYTSHLICVFTDANFRGLPVKKKRITSFLTEGYLQEQYTERWNYFYDNAERITKVEHKINNNPWMLLTENNYDNLGRIAQSSYGTTIDNGNNNVNNYAYNIRGQLTEQVSPHFEQTLFYTSNPYGGNANFNGNISASKISRFVKNTQGAVTKNYMHMSYSYDKFDQLTCAEDRNTAPNWEPYAELFSYDLNGNPISVTRGYGNTPMQEISIGYNGNQITGIANSGYDVLLGLVPQIPNGSFACSYDANGNLYSDSSRGITKTTYNTLNIPDRVDFEDGNYIVNDYRADGIKTMRQNYTKRITTIIKVNANGDTIRTNRVTYDIKTKRYFGDLIKENDYKTSRIYNECGYIDIFNGTFHYNFYVRDYIGSIRAVINQYGEIAQMADYYPCGIPTTEYNDLSQNDRLHTGKEFNAFNGYYTYDNAARYLDPILNRFTTIDPLAEKYPSFSPYTACANNTLRYIDPDGRDIIEMDENGNIVSHTVDKEKDAVYIVAGASKDSNGKYSRIKDHKGGDLGRTFEYGTIKTNSYTYKTEGGDVSTYDVYTIRGDENAESLYTFVGDNISNNSKVEFSLAKAGKEGATGLNFMTSAQKRGTEPGMTYLFLGQLQYGYTIREMSHTHPLSREPSKGDIDFKNWTISKTPGIKINYNFYHTPTKTKIKF